MAKRGRKSQADLQVVQIDVRRVRLVTPEWLSNAEREVFEATIAACSPEHFVYSDIETLCAYCRAAIMMRNANEDAAIERAGRLLASLGTRLRLTPQSRYDSRAAGRKARDAGLPRWHKPWE